MMKAENISKRYGKQNILKDITFFVRPGESAAVVGKNGCGKSTLMQILAGILKPDRGSLRYFDQDPLAKKKVFRTMCGYVPQADPLIGELTVRDNLRLFGAAPEAVHTELLEAFALSALLKTPVAKLSGGMKRRVSIACAVHHQPPILLMDEPSSGLDIYYKALIHEWMRAYLARNGTLVLTTHEEEEVCMCDRCFLMEDGMLTELTQKENRMEQIRKRML